MKISGFNALVLFTLSFFVSVLFWTAFVATSPVRSFSGATGTPVSSSPFALPTVTARPDDIELARLIRVIDGDTIEVSIDGITNTVRYIGVDTPERGDGGYIEAANANYELLRSDYLVLRRDISDRDRYDRLLRYVWTAEGDFVNARMTADGWAQPLEYAPDIKYANEFMAFAADAANNKKGFWAEGQSLDNIMPYGLTTSNARLREGPSQDYAEVGTYPTGTPVTLYGVDELGEWVYIRTPDRATGWMYAGLLRSNVTVGDLEISYAYTPLATPTLPPTETPTAMPTETPTPVPTLVPPTSPTTVPTLSQSATAEDGIVIASVMYGNGEYITVINAGKAPTDTSGWMLFAGEELVYLFPDGEMLPGTLCRIYPAASQIKPFCY